MFGVSVSLAAARLAVGCGGENGGTNPLLVPGADASIDASVDGTGQGGSAGDGSTGGAGGAGGSGGSFMDASDGPGKDAEQEDSQAPQPCMPGQTTDYLDAVMDQFHKRFYVYKDKDAAGNHFAARGRLGDSSDGGSPYLPSMDEGHVGPECEKGAGSCIEAQFNPGGSVTWGGWYFMNGVLDGNQHAPIPNWGDKANAGINLQGATKLTWRARGAVGGERVKFIAFGVGAGAAASPDSAPTLPRDYDTLSTDWKTFEADLTGMDLSYVLGGFGWVSSAAENGGNGITFYVDDISYDKDTTADPRFLLSYETDPTSAIAFDGIMRNVAFTYDNAVALIYFLSVGQTTRARLVADALVYAQNHDRTFTGDRLRNAYQAGDLVLPPGWTPYGVAGTVRMPGRTEPSGTWIEDAIQVGTDTGNMAWAALALLAFYESQKESKYLDAAEKLATFVESNCRVDDALGGYSAGYEGEERDSTGAPKPQTKLERRSIEHNMDLYVVFKRLAALTGNNDWNQSAAHARAFVEAPELWSASDGHFWAGTATLAGDAGPSIEKSVVPLDAQSWAFLSITEWLTNTDRLRALAFAEAHCKVDWGFDFDSDAKAIWFEGSGEMGVLYRLLGQTTKLNALMAGIESGRAPSGGFPATNSAELLAGPDNAPWWIYYPRLHVGATAWAGFAECGTNPFWHSGQ
ncbi:MAG: hypothetical protein HY898_27875 [Deltaproteobacteria bacterium]|nr:hypothetical protein [Deltaproteobacteria bacterium]